MLLHMRSSYVFRNYSTVNDLINICTYITTRDFSHLLCLFSFSVYLLIGISFNRNRIKGFDTNVMFAHTQKMQLVSSKKIIVNFKFKLNKSSLKNNINFD